MMQSRIRSRNPALGVLLIFAGFLCFPDRLFSLEIENTKQASQETQETQSQQNKYRQFVKKQIHKAEVLLVELLERVETQTGEEREALKRTATKINAELNHVKRMFQNFAGKDAEQWLRNKTELNAVMADLDVAYDRAIPFLRDQLRLLQEAVDRIGDALFYKEQKDLFNKMTQSGLDWAVKAQKEGIHSEFLQEAISRLKKAREQLRLDNMEDAVEQARSAYLQLNSALKHQIDSILQN